MAFDPAAATAAYLAQLPPEAHAKAQAYTQGGHWLLLWGMLAAIVAALIVLKLGWLPKIKARLERRRPRPFLSAFVLSLVYVLATSIIVLPWSIYSQWWRERAYGLTSQPLAGWLGQAALMIVISAISTAIFFIFLYWLIRRFPRIWPVWAGVLTSVFLVLALFVAPVFVEPMFNSYREAPAGPVRTMVVDMGRQVGVPTDKILIYDGSKQSNRYTANVSGLFGTARIAMSDVMFAKGADMAEIRGVVGHEMGHYVLRHILSSVLLIGLIAALGGFLTVWLFPRLQRLLGEDRISGVADPTGLPILMIIVAVLGLLFTPLFNTISRTHEAASDNFSLTHFREPDGIAKALVKTIEYRAATPGALEETLFYSHPSVGWRVRNAMEWKARNAGNAPPPAPASPAR